MWELDCSTQGTRVALQRARRALQRHGGNRVLFHGYSRVLKRFPLADHMCLRSYCRQRGEICTRARTASKVDASSSLCKKLGNVTLLDPDGKQTPLPFLDEIRIGSLADAVGAP